MIPILIRPSVRSLSPESRGALGKRRAQSSTLANLGCRLRGLFSKPESLSDQERADVVREAGDALRAGQLETIETIVRIYGNSGRHDAACLNLLGVVAELRGHWAEARRYYGRAIRAEHSYGPGQQNMRRLYELYTFGRSSEALTIGNCCTDLWIAQQLSTKKRQ